MLFQLKIDSLEIKFQLKNDSLKVKCEFVSKLVIDLFSSF